MFLDSFKLESVVFQIRYPEAFRTWDHAGDVAQQIYHIWPGLKLADGQPNQQTFKGKGIQIQSGLTRSTVTLFGADSFTQNKVNQLKNTFDVWCQILELPDLTQVSTLATFVKDFSSLKAANAELSGLNLARWPTEKVFDQPVESEGNGVEVFYRFQDKDSFTTLRLNVEQTKYEVDLDPNFIDDAEIRKTKNQLIVKFDRGVLGSVNSKKFRVEDWIKGYQHVLRRDIEKVLMEQA